MLKKDLFRRPNIELEDAGMNTSAQPEGPFCSAWLPSACLWGNIP